jgi:hypothetical protein
MDNIQEKKLMWELVDDLRDILIGFINLHKLSLSDEELFNILNDANMTYIGSALAASADMLENNKKRDIFLQEAKTIFNLRVDKIKKDAS